MYHLKCYPFPQRGMYSLNIVALVAATAINTTASYTHSLPYLTFLKSSPEDIFIFIDFRERGRGAGGERERERNIDVREKHHSAAPRRQSGDRTQNLGMYPDWRLNLHTFGAQDDTPTH